MELKLSQVKTIERNNRGGKREPGDLRRQAIIKKKKKKTWPKINRRGSSGRLGKLL